MADLIESARAILSLSERRVEATANNVANLTTPGFKSERLYSETSPETDLHAPETSQLKRLDLAQGRLSKTNNPLDLAISGPGMFQFRGVDGLPVYSRSGQFKLGDDGRVVNAQGLALQTADGGDLILSTDAIKVLADGTVMEGERPVARIGLYRPTSGGQFLSIGGSLFRAPGDGVEEVAAPDLRQAMIENSNVVLGDEMVTMMEALRTAEGGARLVQNYDELMGRAISTFGQGAR